MSEPAPLRPLVAGNWKMNGLASAMGELDALAAGLGTAQDRGVDVMICPPATLIAACAQRTRGSSVLIGGQDCHAKASGAHTGDISAEMLADAGARAVIVGHSERRADHGESDADVRAKVIAAHRAGLIAIVCVGETAAEREAGTTLSVIRRQLEGSLPDAIDGQTTVVAYEPVWAIGTGLTPTEQDVEAVHRFIRHFLIARFAEQGAAIRILYGGSVKPSNAAGLMRVPEVAGALVGGASLKASDFLGIIDAYA